MGQSICRSARKKSLKEKSLKRARCLVLLPIIFFTIIDRPLLSSREWLYDFIMARLVLLLFLAFSPLHSVEWCSESIITNNSRVPIPIRPVNFAAYARCCVCLHEQSHKNIDTMTRVFFSPPRSLQCAYLACCCVALPSRAMNRMIWQRLNARVY